MAEAEPAKRQRAFCAHHCGLCRQQHREGLGPPRTSTPGRNFLSLTTQLVFCRRMFHRPIVKGPPLSARAVLSAV
ncbi:hypothetical protein CSUI_001681 [Cystoisospora suis]|uniref:Uncharacterized protein n=1 Tax=Cystoisospora suis TaxID=483139 RepID=A0A2C6LBH2_9APIC|nr:hypothetical protein CSUI_001681 [Cystoisospora suis]